MLQLYIFRFLHQTTTYRTIFISSPGCISFVFYIKPQLVVNQYVTSDGCISFVFYIKPQPIVLLRVVDISCISFVFYIKPQLITCSPIHCIRCISFVFYIKPQLRICMYSLLDCCISFVFYIKPQRICTNTLIIIYLKYKLSTRSSYIYDVLSTKISKKFQLNWSFNLFFCSLTKNCFNIRILLICNCKHTYLTRNRHNRFYSFLMDH